MDSPSALGRGEWSALRPGRFTPGKDPGTCCTGDWFRPCGEENDISFLCWDSNPGSSSPLRSLYTKYTNLAPGSNARSYSKFIPL